MAGDRAGVGFGVCCENGRFNDGHDCRKQPGVVEERKVLVGRMYREMSPTWTEWLGVSFDEAVARMRGRRQDRTAKDMADEVIEVTVMRRATVTTEISVEEVPI